MLNFVTILQEERIRAEVLPEDYDFEAHKKLVAMQPGDMPITYANYLCQYICTRKRLWFKPNTSLRIDLRNFANGIKIFIYTIISSR